MKLSFISLLLTIVVIQAVLTDTVSAMLTHCLATSQYDRLEQWNSCFSLETENSILIFDFWMDPARVLKPLLDSNLLQ